MNINKPSPIKIARYSTSATWPLGMTLDVVKHHKQDEKVYGPLV